MSPAPPSPSRPAATTLAGLAAAALISAVIPAAAGLAFLISLAARRPLVEVAARHWPWLAGRKAAQPSHRTLTGLTAAWAAGLLAAAAIQGAGAITGGLSFTSPAAFAARALIALAAEAILAALTIAWLHRNPAPGPHARSTTPDPSLTPGPEDPPGQHQDRHDPPPHGKSGPTKTGT